MPTHSRFSYFKVKHCFSLFQPDSQLKSCTACTCYVFIFILSHQYLLFKFLLTCLTIQHSTWLLRSPHFQIPETTNSTVCTCMYLQPLLGLFLAKKNKKKLDEFTLDQTVVSTECGAHRVKKIIKMRHVPAFCGSHSLLLHRLLNMWLNKPQVCKCGCVLCVCLETVVRMQQA